MHWPIELILSRNHNKPKLSVEKVKFGNDFIRFVSTLMHAYLKTSFSITQIAGLADVASVEPYSGPFDIHLTPR